MSKSHSSYIIGSVEQFFRDLVSLMNKISPDPLNEERNKKIRVPFFPFIWDLNQFYFIMKEFYHLRLFDNMGFIITSRNYSEIHESFLFKFIETNEEEIGTGQTRLDFEIIPLNIQKQKGTFKQLRKLIGSFNVQAFKFVQNYVLEELNFNLGLLFILPEHIAHLGVQENIDYINSDVLRYFKDFFGLLHKGLTEEMKKMPVIEYSSKVNRENPLVNLFIKFASDWVGVNINQMFDFFTQMMEGLNLNLLVVNRQKNPISIGRIIIENGIIHINPVPLEFVKEQIIGLNIENISELAKHLYNRTKTHTLTIDSEDFYSYLMRFNDSEYTLLSSVLDLILLSSRYGTYPESIFSQLLYEIGIDSNKAIKYLKDTIISLVKYYERILVGTLQINAKGVRELNSLFYICASDKGNLIHKPLNPKSYKLLFANQKTTVAINELEERVSKDTNFKYPLVAIIKLKILTEIFSLQNLQSLAEMNKFKHNLPSLEKLASILTDLSNNKISTNGSDSVDKEKERTDLIEDIPSINHFLAKGITIKSSKDKILLRMDKGEEGKGYLGLDIEKLKAIIKDKFPEILLD